MTIVFIKVSSQVRLRATESTGKIDDERMLELFNEGKNQVEIAAIFDVTKQAVSKRLKALRASA
jgi:hypothetical protein